MHRPRFVLVSDCGFMYGVLSLLSSFALYSYSYCLPVTGRSVSVARATEVRSIERGQLE